MMADRVRRIARADALAGTHRHLREERAALSLVTPGTLDHRTVINQLVRYETVHTNLITREADDVLARLEAR